MAVPGNVGSSIFSDESIELWRDPLAYIDKRVKEHGPVFSGRVLNKSTIFITSSDTVREMLCDNHDSFSSGYHEYMFELFGENIMFLEGDEWRMARDLLKQSFSDTASLTMDIARQLIKDHIKATPTNKPLKLYQHFKSLTTQLSISLFLSHTLSEAVSHEVSALMTTHWHGIISLPVNMRLPLLSWRSGYGKALNAKDKLIKIISDKLETNKASPIATSVYSPTPLNVNPSSVDSTQSPDSPPKSYDLAVRNILLFISALFPKAMASLMTSILLQLTKPEHSRYLSVCLGDGGVDDADSDQMMEGVILECQRLWPPFLGGRRICSKSCNIGGYPISEGKAAVYISHTANRDGSVFSEPDVFRPERWFDSALNKDLVWSFGGGPRSCAGRHLSTRILKEWLKLTLSSLSWQLSSSTEAPYKVLPVLRPSDDVIIVFDGRGRNTD